MMTNNPRFTEFKEQLAAKGVTIQWMWEARRDGRKPQWGLGRPGVAHRPADIGMIAFSGNGFQPSVLCAVVIDYEQQGFSLFIDDSNKIQADVDRIATPHQPA